MTVKRTWRVFCVEEAAFQTIENLPESVVPGYCPNDVAHTITASKSSVVRVIKPELDNTSIQRSTGEVSVLRSKGEPSFIVG